MQRNVSSLCAVLMLIASAIFLSNWAAAQEGQAQAAAPPLEDQLKAQFTLIKSCSDNNPTVLVVQQNGIIGFPQSDMTTLATRYHDGQLESPKTTRRVLGQEIPIKKNVQAFNVGFKVSPTSIAVNTSKDSVTVGILACSLGYKAVVAFEFPKGTLQKMGVPDVMDTISKVFAFDQSGDPGPQAQQQQAPQPDQQQQQADDNQAQPEPQKIHIGQTSDEVIAALGQPDKKIDLGPKKIFIYKDVKITFKDGKVADAE